jgi:ketosteroid isomerase-like protein
MHQRDKLTNAGDGADFAFVPDRQWWRGLFDRIDARDAHGFATFLTPDAEFRFANASVVIGRAAITAAVGGFFAAIGSSRHEFFDIWNGAAKPGRDGAAGRDEAVVCDGAAGCEGEVTYSRRDGSVIAYPFANVLRLQAEKIASYHIYIDNSTLFAASVSV